MRTRRERLAFRVKLGQVALPGCGELAADNAFQLLRILGVGALPRLELLVPCVVELLALLDAAVPHRGQHLVGHLKLAVLPLELLARELGLVGAERRAMRRV